MSFWAAILVLLLVALLIPVISILLDAPLFRRAAPPPTPRQEALPPGVPTTDAMEQLARRVVTLEDEVDELNRTIRELRDEVEFLRALLEGRDPPER